MYNKLSYELNKNLNEIWGSTKEQQDFSSEVENNRVGTCGLSRGGQVKITDKIKSLVPLDRHTGGGDDAVSNHRACL